MPASDDRSRYAGAFWKARDEDIRSSATALSGFLEQLGTLDESWSSWYEAVPPGVPMRRVDSVASIEVLFRARRERDGAETINTRHVITLWNGVDEGISLHFRCGFRTAVPGLPFPNACTVDVHPYSLSADMSVTLGENVVAALVSSFRPDWAVVSSREVDALRGERRGGPRVGWVTYLRTQRLPTLPGEISSRPLGEGTILVVGAGEKDPTKTERLSDVARLTALLEEAGCLDPSSV